MNDHQQRALKGNLKSIMASGGTLAASGATANAAIVFTSLNSGSGVTIDPGDKLYFNITSGETSLSSGVVSGGDQFYLTVDAGQNNYFIWSPDNNNNVLNFFSVGAYFASRLTAGSEIASSSTTFVYYGFLNYTAPLGTPEWNPGDTGYLGLQLNDGSTYYAWAEVTYNNDGSLNLGGFAYEDTGASILAGDVGAVPESKTAGLAMALLAGCSAAFRRRRERRVAL